LEPLRRSSQLERARTCSALYVVCSLPIEGAGEVPSACAAWRLLLLLDPPLPLPLAVLALSARGLASRMGDAVGETGCGDERAGCIVGALSVCGEAMPRA
jgi:hypothetical protein